MGSSHTLPVLGVDIGGVIISRSDGGSDTSFRSENYLETPEVPGVVEALSRLAAERFGNRIFLVSKCGPRTQTKTLRWLKHHRFFARTGLNPENIRFCLERSDKAGICSKLRVTHFVDDRLDVLLNLKTVKQKYLFEPDATTGQQRSSSSGIMSVGGWHQVVAAILRESE